MSLDSDVKVLTDKDFKARFGSASYNKNNPEMRNYHETRHAYWRQRLIEERRTKQPFDLTEFAK